MAFLEALFAGFGVVAFIILVLILLLLLADEDNGAAGEQPQEADPALPYREALAAALRIQEAGALAEADMQAAASRYRSFEGDRHRHT